MRSDPLTTASITIPPQWREPAFHPTYTRLLCTVLRNSVPDSKVLSVGELNVAQLATQQMFVSFEVSSGLILEVVRLTGRPWLGMELGAMTQVSAHGPLGYAVASSRDIMQALETVSRFAGLRTRAMEFRLSPHDGNTDIVIRERFDFGEVRAFILEAVVVMLARMIEWLSGQSLERAEYQLPYARPSWAEKHAGVLKGRLRFGSSSLRIRIPNDILHTPCLSSDPVAYASACRECEQKPAVLESEDSLARSIRNRLRERGRLSLAGDLGVRPARFAANLDPEAQTGRRELPRVTRGSAQGFGGVVPAELVRTRRSYRRTSRLHGHVELQPHVSPLVWCVTRKISASRKPHFGHELLRALQAPHHTNRRSRARSPALRVRPDLTALAAELISSASSCLSCSCAQVW